MRSAILKTRLLSQRFPQAVSRISSVRLNLEVNAADAMPSGGELIFEAHNFVCAQESGEIDRLGLTAGRYVVISILDQGFGMNNAVKASAFGPQPT